MESNKKAKLEHSFTNVIEQNKHTINLFKEHDVGGKIGIHQPHYDNDCVCYIEK